MDNGVVFLKGNTNEWEPVSLEDLILKQKVRAKSSIKKRRQRIRTIPGVAETDIGDLD